MKKSGLNSFLVGVKRFSKILGNECAPTIFLKIAMWPLLDMLINLAEETPPGIEAQRLKSTPKKLKIILLLKRSAKSAKKHTKRKPPLTQTQRHAKTRVNPFFGGG